VSLFQELTRSGVRTLEKVKVIQIHGFQRNSETPQDLRFVISDGTRSGSVFVENVATRLKQEHGDHRALVYRRETRLLSAKTNEQGKSVRSLGGEFLHLEISVEQREHMRDTPEAMAGLAEALDL
jgi:hypothetical protein